MSVSHSARPSPLFPLGPGQWIGKCEIRRLLGRGTLAEVYRAFSPELSADVAVKVLRPPTKEGSEAAVEARFQRVVGAISRLHHPNIARIYDFGLDGGRLFILMELVEGPSLRDMLSARRGAFPLDQAMTIFRQVAEAINYAHTQDIVHEDLRPGNVLLAEGTRPVVADFGLRRVLGEDDLTTVELSPRAPTYMSPEQASGRGVSKQTDIYSLGVMLYEMVTGDVPFRGDSATRILVQHMQAVPRPPSELNVEVPPRVEAAILRALAKTPGERFPSALDMVEALVPPPTQDDYDTVTLSREGAKDIRQQLHAAVDEVAPPIEVETPHHVTHSDILLLVAVAVVMIVIVVIITLLSRGLF
ncbi:MAG: serine/threonine protein kinase [Anaerolineae bacterium]|nr:serine/threonine protein kinase [Anaerolineae bacterium]